MKQLLDLTVTITYTSSLWRFVMIFGAVNKFLKRISISANTSNLRIVCFYN